MNFKSPYVGLVVGLSLSVLFAFGFSYFHKVRSQNTELKSQVLRLMIDRDLDRSRSETDKNKPLLSDDTREQIKRFDIDTE